MRTARALFRSPGATEKEACFRTARKTGLGTTKCSFTAGNENDNSTPKGKEGEAFANGGTGNPKAIQIRN